jgi:hypothetical protein
VGRYSKELDAAFSGKHTRILYLLAQLRTKLAQLNGYLHRIGRAEFDLCACGQARETIKHFLFRCTRWNAYRTQMLEQTDTRRGNLSFYLGGKSPYDTEKRRLNMNAVRATIKFTMATKGSQSRNRNFGKQLILTNSYASPPPVLTSTSPLVTQQVSLQSPKMVH